MKLLKKLKQPDRAGRMALRFFAGMIVLTLLARGTAGAAMARVKLQRIGSGSIVQQTSATASLIAEDGEAIPLPAGITVEKLWAAAGKTVEPNAPLLQLNCEELQDALEKAVIQLAQQKARLAQLNSHTPPDTSGVAAAQQALAQSGEDTALEEQRANEAVDLASQQQQAAQQAYNDAVAARDALSVQTDPAPTEEELTEANSAVRAAKADLTSAEEALRSAQAARKDTLLAAKRRTESAQQALNAANAQLAQAKKQDALTQQSNQADASSAKRDIKKSEEQIQLLKQALDAEGFFAAPRTAQVIRCDLQVGQPCPERSPLVLSKEGSVLLAQFSLPQKTAEKVFAGQEISLSQNQKAASATVQAVSEPDPEEQCQVTAAVNEKDAAYLQADLGAEAVLIFSRTNYPSCVPISAIRQDADGAFVLAVEQQKTTFGVTNTVVRIPVTVLEVDSNGAAAAVEGALPETIIVESDRAIKPGSSVRIES